MGGVEPKLGIFNKTIKNDLKQNIDNIIKLFNGFEQDKKINIEEEKRLYKELSNIFNVYNKLIETIDPEINGFEKIKELIESLEVKCYDILGIKINKEEIIKAKNGIELFINLSEVGKKKEITQEINKTKLENKIEKKSDNILVSNEEDKIISKNQNMLERDLNNGNENEESYGNQSMVIKNNTHEITNTENNIQELKNRLYKIVNAQNNEQQHNQIKRFEMNPQIPQLNNLNNSEKSIKEDSVKLDHSKVTVVPSNKAKKKLTKEEIDDKNLIINIIRHGIKNEKFKELNDKIQQHKTDEDMGKYIENLLKLIRQGGVIDYLNAFYCNDINVNKGLLSFDLALNIYYKNLDKFGSFENALERFSVFNDEKKMNPQMFDNKNKGFKSIISNDESLLRKLTLKKEIEKELSDVIKDINKILSKEEKNTIDVSNVF